MGMKQRKSVSCILIPMPAGIIGTPRTPMALILPGISRITSWILHRKTEPILEKLLTHTENTSISRYVWLPIEWEGDKPVIRWQKGWTLAEALAPGC